MCGISVYFSRQPLDAIHISRMTDSIRHRGPDDEGFVFFHDLKSPPRVFGGKDTPRDSYNRNEIVYSPKVQISQNFDDYPVIFAMGHRRLSVIDLSPLGHQPMCTSDMRYWIVYNGEIYNHLEIRKELEKIGYNFISHSDTEVILAAYSKWGDQCLSRLNGMFAFLIYDAEKKKLFAARDRFGIKPLYYRISKDGFSFVSEIKQLTLLPDWKAKMNGQRAYDFLNWGITDHTDETLFEGVFQLRGGQNLLIDLEAIFERKIKYHEGGRFPVEQWYQLTSKEVLGDPKDLTVQFREKMFESVKSHLRTDVSMGFCLSGGLDSSSIVCIAKQLLQEKDDFSIQKTFTACTEVSKIDERKWVEIIDSTKNLNAYYIYPSLNNLFNELPKITWYQDEPFGSTSIYAQWNVFQLAAKNNVKVILDGQGADEQLAGYHGYFGPYLVTLLTTFKFNQLIKEFSAIHKIHGYSYFNILARMVNTILPEILKNKVNHVIGRASTLSTYLNIEKFNCIPINPMSEIGASSANTIKKLSYAQLTASNLQMLLHWEDRDSMAHSIESRVPFLDYKLVEFSLGLPDKLKISDGITKRILRESMYGIIPDPIRVRMDKIGFATPEEAWFRDPESDIFRKKFEAAIEETGGLINKKKTLELVSDILSEKVNFNCFPWRVISFAEWMKQFKVNI